MRSPTEPASRSVKRFRAGGQSRVDPVQALEQLCAERRVGRPVVTAETCLDTTQGTWSVTLQVFGATFTGTARGKKAARREAAEAALRQAAES